MQSLRIIQRCDHTKRIESEIMKSVELYRQEVRESVVLSASSQKISYHGNWIETLDDKNEVLYKTNADEEARCAIFFYGDDITIYALSQNFVGPLYVYLDGELVDTVTEVVNDKNGEFPVVAIAELNYAAHIVELSFTTDFSPAAIKVNSLNASYDEATKDYMINSATYDKSSKNLVITGATYNSSTKNLTIPINTQTAPTLSIKKIFCSQILVDEVDDSDVISKDDIIKEISRVYQGEEGQEDFVMFWENVDYELFGGNKIRWIGIKRPKAHAPYVVEYIQKTVSFKTFIPDECEKCYGLGWYGCLQNLSTNQPSRATGVERITEDIIRFILTPYDENTGYGSEFLNLLKENYLGLDDIETYATSEIERIAEAYKAIQTKEIINGASYSNEDKLDTINIDDIHFDVNTLRLYMALTVSNTKGEQSTVEEAFEL